MLNSLPAFEIINAKTVTPYVWDFDVGKKRKQFYMTLHMFITMQSRLAALKVFLPHDLQPERNIKPVAASRCHVEGLRDCKAHANAADYLLLCYKANVQHVNRFQSSY